MVERFKSLLGRRGVAAAAACAGGVAVVVVLQTVVEALVNAGMGGLAGMPPAAVFEFAAGMAARRLVTEALPFGIGVFLSLWLVAPIAAELRLAHVISRAVLAAANGAAVVFVAACIAALVTRAPLVALASFGSSTIGTVGELLGQSMLAGITSALLVLVALVPLTVLAAVLLWIWLQEHPAKHPVSGMVDEV